MEWWMIGAIVIGAILLAIYAVVATITFMNLILESAISSAFGWGGFSLIEAFIVSALWPILMPIGLIWGLIDDIRDR